MSEIANKFRILIVDDERDIIDTIHDALLDEKYILDTEIDSEVALEKIKKNHYDLVLTDVMMPKLTGMDLVNAVAELKVKTKVIVITAHATVDTAIESVKLGVYDYIHKPIKRFELRHLIEKARQHILLDTEVALLNSKNQQLLKNHAFVLDLSKILYQVSNIRIAVQMIMDSVQEYFNLAYCAIFHEDLKTDKLHYYPSSKMEAMVGDSTLDLPLKVNNSALSQTEVNRYKLEQKKIEINSTIFSFEQEGTILFFPIRFQNRRLGSLMALLPKESARTELMLNNLATQIAPVMHTFSVDESVENDVAVDDLHILHDHIRYADKIASPISFALIRLEVVSASGEAGNILNTLKKMHQFIEDQMQSTYSVHWKSPDTGLLILPEADHFKGEIFCKNLVDKTEQEFDEKDNDLTLTLQFACISYPESGHTAHQVNEHLWVKLFHELSLNRNQVIEQQVVN